MKSSVRVLVLFAIVLSVIHSSSAVAGKKKIYSIDKTIVLNFEGARNHCKSKGKTLASVVNINEQQFLEERIIREGLWDKTLWLGGKHTTRGATWVDSEVVFITYGKWLGGDRLRTGGQCLLVNKKTEPAEQRYRWGAAPCSQQHLAVCQHFE